MPEHSNEGLVPPLKVLRKRLNGVYRADGFAGPTRRYVLVVALLVGLASLPTLAAITAGTNELDRGTAGAMDVPFLPPPSSGPVEPARPAPSPSHGVLHGQAGERRTMPHRYRHSDIRRSGRTVRAGRPAGSHPPSSAGTSAVSRTRPAPPTAATDDPVPPGSFVAPNKPDEPARPVDPVDQPLPTPGSPLCHERGKCGLRESRHHRPDWSPHRQCEDATHRAHWSHHREGRSRSVAVPVVPTGRHGRYAAVREQHADARPHSRLFRSIVSHRSSDRSEPTWRSSLTERPSNIRTERGGDRTHNSRRHHSESRWDDGQAYGRPYYGAHRAGDLHVAAYDRSSRMGHHHAGRHRDYTDRW